MIDPVDRVRRVARTQITEDTGRLVANGRLTIEERPAVELRCKQVQVGLWAPRVRQPDASERDRAATSVSD